MLCFLNTAAFAQNVSTLAGNGTAGYVNGQGASATFNNAYGAITADAQGNVYVADAGNFCVRKITPAGVVTTFSGPLSAGTPGTNDNGTPGVPSTARYQLIGGIGADAQGNLYTTEPQNPVIRKISPSGDVLSFSGVPRADYYNCRYTNGASSVAEFYFPGAVCVSKNGNVYVAETYKIRKIDPAGTVTILAGDPSCAQPLNASQGRGDVDGNGTNARFWGIVAMTVVSDGPNDYLYVISNYCVRKISPNGSVETIAGASGAGGAWANGIGTSARFKNPLGIAADRNGNLYVTDETRILKITFKSGQADVGLVAGTGTVGFQDGIAKEQAQFTNAYGIAYWYDAATQSDVLYIMDNNRVRALRLTPPIVTTFSPRQAYQGQIVTINGDNFDNATHVYLGGVEATIVSISTDPITPDAITVRVGPGQTGDVCVETPGGIGCSSNNPAPYKTFTFLSMPLPPCPNRADRVVKTIVGAGTGSMATDQGSVYEEAIINPTLLGIAPGGNAVDPNIYFVQGAGIVRPVRGGIYFQVIADAVKSLRGSVNTHRSGGGGNTPGIFDFTIDSQGYIYYMIPHGTSTPNAPSEGVFRFDTRTQIETQIYPNGQGDVIALDKNGGVFFVVNTGALTSKQYKIFKIKADGSIIHIGGSGVYGSTESPIESAVNAKISQISSMVVDNQGNIYLLDANAGRILKMQPMASNPDQYTLTFYAGSGNDGYVDGPGFSAKFLFDNVYSKLALDPRDNTLYVSDTRNHVIRRITASQQVCTVAGIPGSPGLVDGNANNARFNYPCGIAFDPRDEGLYVADRYNNRIRKISFWRPSVVTLLNPSAICNSGTTPVEIVGREFTGATAVQIGGQNVPSFTVVSDTRIIATIPALSPGQYPVTVTTPGGSGSSMMLTVTLPATITSFTPDRGGMNTQVNIYGTNFYNVTSVRFGGEFAKSFQVLSPTLVRAVVDRGNSGNVEVVSACGSALSSTSFTFGCSICP
ncbi:MAG: IPT/TIG domain-containing protein, partial [Candidatus Kapabacteria bacterium]|nr:IPT/TIG domain-containing protein [Candidatus Kapabacteria bacterium]